MVDAEAVAVAYCFRSYNDTRPMPDDFIQSAHFVRVLADPPPQTPFGARAVRLPTGVPDLTVCRMTEEHIRLRPGHGYVRLAQDESQSVRLRRRGARDHARGSCVAES